jgi:FkbM family methyltransferase
MTGRHRVDVTASVSVRYIVDVQPARSPVADIVGRSVGECEPWSIRNARRNSRGAHRVPSVTLDHLVAQYGIEQIDLLKVNIEGGEQQAFAGMLQTIDLVRNVAVSCHDFIGSPTSLSSASS